MTAAPVEQLLRWNVWANSCVAGVLEAAGGLPHEALRAFQHVFEAEVTWLRRIAGLQLSNVPLWAPASLDGLGALRDQASSALALLLERLDDEFLASTFDYANSSGRRFSDRVEDSLLHMLFHSQQYRGEAAAFLNAAGARVPDFDYIGWLRQGRPD